MLIQKDFQVAIEVEEVLISHRGLFSGYLKNLNGVIIHFGNPEFRENRTNGFFASELLEWEIEPQTHIKELILNEHKKDLQREDRFRFLDRFTQDFQIILEAAIKNSPYGKALFLSDIQFGPEPALISTNYSIESFWETHDQYGLAFNTLYEISK